MLLAHIDILGIHILSMLDTSQQLLLFKLFSCWIMLANKRNGIFANFGFVTFFIQRNVAQSYVAIDWSGRTYGPDGPWNALSVNVGGLRNSTPIATQQVQVDLYPGSISSTFLPYNVTCDPTKNLCDHGVTWSPTYDRGMDPVSEQDFSMGIDYQPSFDDNTTNTYFRGHLLDQAITLGGQTVYQANLVSYGIGALPAGQNVVTYPNGVKADPPLGLLALNAGTNDKSVETHVEHSATNVSAGYASAWIPAGYLHNQSVIPSYSYGLHIGSAALDYPGSLYLGGYDKGRLIGPYTTYSSQNPTLLDIEIGVETGGSPFSFQNKTGLLLSDGDNPKINVEIIPHSPSLYLPPQTCESLVKVLPVYFDQVTKYYLWNTSDPLYQEVVGSPAYLSFVFPPAPGALDNVNIKIPFALLNLTLTSPIVSSPVQYFPCQPTIPNSNTGIRFALGRAFLQGAFVGWNTNANIGWLAQAPGPGDSNNGLGSEGKNIADDATELDVYDGTKKNYFAQSWSKHWTPLPPSSTAPSSTASPSTDDPTHTPTQRTSGLSTAVIAGISVGGGVGLVALVAGIILCIMTRRRKQKADKDIPLSNRRESFKTDENVSIESLSRSRTPPPPFTSRPTERNQGYAYHIAEMPGQREVQELPWESISRPVRREQRDIHELGLPPTPRPN
jgi:hypothetical protein